MSRRKTYEEVISDFILNHGDEYDYSLLNDFFNDGLYINTSTKLPIICKKHGVFYQSYNKHFTRQHGCPKCASSGIKYTIDEYKKKIFEIFGDDITVISNEYVNSHVNIKFKCKYHGEFETKPYYLLQGHTCPLCGNEKLSKSLKLSDTEIIERFVNTHKNKYDYSNFKYIGYEIPSEIICHKIGKNGKEHGSFLQTPHSHISGCGCPVCNRSHLEKEIGEFLDNENILYNEQKKFSWLGLLELDFYLPKYEIVIECQGAQHYMPCNFGSKNKTPEEMFDYIKERDIKKNNLCKEHGIKVIYYTHVIDQNENTFNNKKDLKKYLDNYVRDKQNL